MEERAKKTPRRTTVIAAYLGILAIFVAVAALLMKGAVWLSAKALPILNAVNGWLFVACILIFIPLLAIRSTRGFAGTALLVASYLFGINLWMISCLLVYSMLGLAGLVIGCFLAGVGVIPLALVGLIVHAMWLPLLMLVLTIATTIGFWLLGARFSSWVSA